MGRKNSHLTCTDQFCGAGGSGQGVKRLSVKMGGGIEVKMAMNHWPLAIDTYGTNFPDVLLDCADASAVDPRKYPSTDILITSPECTNQTGANGKKKPVKQLDIFNPLVIDASEERSRATMWDVPRFAEYHNYNLIIVENVVEAKKWIMFDSWIHAMRAMGYHHKCVYLNSMFFPPTPQSRDRMYVVFWKKKNKAPDLEFNPNAWCATCEKDISAFQWWKPSQKTYKYKTGYLYRCPKCTSEVHPYYYSAFNCIDWNIAGTRIGDYKKPLSINTIRRIKIGRKNFWNENYMFRNFPFIVKTENSKAKDDSYVRSITEALQTQCTRQTFGLLTSPLIVQLQKNGKCTDIKSPLNRITTGGFKHGLLTPFMVENKGQSTSRNIQDPISTFTTNVYHGLLTTEAFNSFISYYNGGSDVSSSLSNPVGALTGTDRAAIVLSKPNVPEIEDCYYRTLRAKEVKLGMGFDPNYIIHGSQRDQVKQAGNAVTPPVMEWLMERGIQTFK